MRPAQPYAPKRIAVDPRVIAAKQEEISIMREKAKLLKVGTPERYRAEDLIRQYETQLSALGARE